MPAISSAASPTATQTSGPEPSFSTDSEAFVVSSLDPSGAPSVADPLADGDAEPDGFGFAEALEDAEALGLADGCGLAAEVGLGFGFGAGGGV